MRSLRTHRFHIAGIAALALLAPLGTGLAVAGPAAADPTTRFVATDGTDMGDCSDQASPCKTIQYAVDQADPGDTVSVKGGKYDESVDIRTSLTVVGAGATGTGRTTVDGTSGDSGPTFFIDGVENDVAPEVTLRDLDISGNQANDGVLVDEATVHIIDSVVNDNDGAGLEAEFSIATVSGSSIDGNGMGVSATPADVAISDSDVSNNASGGVIGAGGEVDITRSSVNHNGDGSDDGLSGFGVAVFSGSAAIDHSTVDGNGSFGIFVFAELEVGAARPNEVIDAPTATVDHTTVSNNGFSGVAVGPGGSSRIDTSTLADNFVAGLLTANSAVEVNNSTITGTKEADADQAEGGIVNENVTEDLGAKRAGAGAFSHTLPKTIAAFAHPSAKVAASPKVKVAAKPAAVVSPGVLLNGTIDADNTTLDDCVGSVNDGGYNLASDDTCTFDATGSKENGTAKLGPLNDNGGPTLTAKPAKGSDAIDAIPAGKVNCASGADDQRGVERPQPAGGNCDIGAVEVEQTPIVITPPQLPHGRVGEHYSVTINATGGLGAPYVWTLAAGPLPAGLTFSSNGVISGTPTESGRFPITVSVDDPVEKDYVLIIDAPSAAAVSTSPLPPLANTGADVRPFTTLGATSIGLGVVLLAGVAYAGRRYRRAH